MESMLHLAAAEIKEPTTAGWILMIGSVSFVVILVGWCFKRVLTADPPIETDVPAGKGP
ncbi:MAG: hypothetical protein IPH13_09530 [Planctomycetes bacterium]|nr:hypothetical protein [Planctomycetota bacterium]MCC7168927.1 hypothetical protein [Planctomycetota bacterium]